MKLNVLFFNAILLMLSCLEVLHAENALESAAPAVRPRIFPIVDHLPLALYNGEPLTLCLRVENVSNSPVTVRLLAKAVLHNGKERHFTDRIELPANGFGSYRRDFDLENVTGIVFEASSDLGEVHLPPIVPIRDQMPWPEVQTQDGRLVLTANEETERKPEINAERSLQRPGAIAIAIIERKNKEDQRAFAPLRWLFDRSESNETRTSNALCLLPQRWISVAQPVFASRTALKKLELKGLTEPPLDGVAPVMHLLQDSKRAIEKSAAKACLLFLPAEDLLVATEPRLYRLACDRILIGLQQYGIQEVILVPPFRFGIPLTVQQQRWKAAQEAATMRGARVVPVLELLAERYWRVDPNVDGVYGSYLNQSGFERLCEYIEAWTGRSP